MFLYAVVLYAEWWRYSRQLFSIRRNNQFQYIWLSVLFVNLIWLWLMGNLRELILPVVQFTAIHLWNYLRFSFTDYFFFLLLCLIIFYFVFSRKNEQNEQKNCFNYILIKVCRKEEIHKFEFKCSSSFKIIIMVRIKYCVCLRLQTYLKHT